MMGCVVPTYKGKPPVIFLNAEAFLFMGKLATDKHMCVPCQRNKGMRWDEYGQLTRIVCCACVRAAQRAYPCKCGRLVFVSPLGHVAPRCQACYRGAD